MDGTNLGILTLIPVVSFFLLALLTKKCITSIILSGALGYLLYYKAGFFMPMTDALFVYFPSKDTQSQFHGVTDSFLTCHSISVAKPKRFALVITV